MQIFRIRTELLCVDTESDSLVHEAVERYQRTIVKSRHPMERIGITYPIVSVGPQWQYRNSGLECGTKQEKRCIIARNTVRAAFYHLFRRLQVTNGGRGGRVTARCRAQSWLVLILYRSLPLPLYSHVLHV